MRFASTVISRVARSSSRGARNVKDFTGSLSSFASGVAFSPMSSPYASSPVINNIRAFGNTTRLEETISKEDARGLFHLWNDALATLDSDKVASRYAKETVLLSTVSDITRTDYAGLKDYFDNFLLLKPQGVIRESYVTTGDNWCKDVGTYEFTMGASGAKVNARYTFVYVYEDGEWKIAHHHSSRMPEEVMADIAEGKGPGITEEEVRGLFSLWNDALATLDSEAVAKRYAKNSVLLPTIIDNPCTDYASRKDYFDTFLLRKPQGEILQSFVTIGQNGEWCKDVGTYEFTMGATGDKVKARYTFVYVWEDEEWKIEHHHSSIMPEAFL